MLVSQAIAHDVGKGRGGGCGKHLQESCEPSVLPPECLSMQPGAMTMFNDQIWIEASMVQADTLETMPADLQGLQLAIDCQAARVMSTQVLLKSKQKVSAWS